MHAAARRYMEMRGRCADYQLISSAVVRQREHLNRRLCQKMLMVIPHNARLPTLQ
jgi:hypothetical protein